MRMQLDYVIRVTFLNEFLQRLPYENYIIYNPLLENKILMQVWHQWINRIFFKDYGPDGMRVQNYVCQVITHFHALKANCYTIFLCIHVQFYISLQCSRCCVMFISSDD